eukprot:13989949-Alexandrium_andersonii.AAC.1
MLRGGGPLVRSVACRLRDLLLSHAATAWIARRGTDGREGSPPGGAVPFSLRWPGVVFAATADWKAGAAASPDSPAASASSAGSTPPPAGAARAGAVSYTHLRAHETSAHL